jgi:hypothetical protein
MPSTATWILIAAAGAGVYYATRPIEEVKEVWTPPKHDSMPDMTNFIKPDDPPSPTIYTDVKTGTILNPPTYRPGSFMDRYIKKRGFLPGF